MDLSSAFKTEVYRPVVTIVTPGLVALAPYAYLVSAYNPALFKFALENTILTSVVSLLAVISAGFLLEDFGSQIESSVWESLQGEEKKKEITEDWHNYLRLAFVTEPVGQKYISTLVTRMKFELGLSLALFICVPGLLWLKYKMCVDFHVVAIISLVFLAGYLLWESYHSSKVLCEVRHELLEGINVVGKAT